MRQVIFTLITLIFTSFSLFAQKTNTVYQSYIDQYKSMAVDQMLRYRIPASITLAQGLLESGAGRSTLATQANNHFGVKCGGQWNGPYVTRDDDAKGEHFRKYTDAAQSYEDHSQFLLKSRYASLFSLSPTDYKGWAHGLKRCGYATNPVYAESLITIIENYKLYQFDTMTSLDQVGYASTVTTAPQTIVRQTVVTPPVDDFFKSHPVSCNNHNFYIVTRAGDTLKEIANESGVSSRKLRRYNELPRRHTLTAGSIIYFGKKASKAEKKYKGKCHVLTANQSLYDVSQIYGIKLKSLYKLNNLKNDFVPQAGFRVRLY